MKLRISTKIQIPMSEIETRHDRSSGPGGQHVNKSNTKVTLSWSLENNRSIQADIKSKLRERLKAKLTTDGRLVLSSDRFRSQERNLEDCLQKLESLLKKAAFEKKKRKATRPTRASKEKRLEKKKNHSEKKQSRKKIDY